MKTRAPTETPGNITSNKNLLQSYCFNFPAVLAEVRFQMVGKKNVQAALDAGADREGAGCMYLGKGRLRMMTRFALYESKDPQDIKELKELMTRKPYLPGSTLDQLQKYVRRRRSEVSSEKNISERT